METDNIDNILFVNKEIKEIRNIDSILWQLSASPGGNTLIGGNMEAGFYGEVPVSELISGDELAKKIGLTSGRSQNSNEPWLKFAYKGDILYIAKKIFRIQIDWNSLNEANAVYGDRIIEHNGLKFAIMIPRGTGEDKQPDPKKFIKETRWSCLYKSMWNKLILPIHKQAPRNWGYGSNVESPTEKWGPGYSDSDLTMKIYTWCQESAGSEFKVMVRGLLDVSYSDVMSRGIRGDYHGWRPVLKLVE